MYFEPYLRVPKLGTGWHSVCRAKKITGVIVWRTKEYVQALLALGRKHHNSLPNLQDPSAKELCRLIAIASILEVIV